MCDKLLRRMVMIMAAKAFAHWAERVTSDLEARQKIAVYPSPLPHPSHTSNFRARNFRAITRLRWS